MERINKKCMYICLSCYAQEYTYLYEYNQAVNTHK